MKYYIFTDGGARGNPGNAGVGYVIFNEKNKIEDFFGDYIGVSTNNIAEYKALIEGISKLIKIGAKDVEILMDSELIVKQINGLYKVKDEKLKEMYSKVISLLSSFEKYKISHIPREKNKFADKLVNLALDIASKKY